MRADRLITMVLLLQRYGHRTAAQLSEELDVTERTIYRDIEALSMAGVPIYTQSGPHGGCFLDEAYRTSLNWFTGAELQTLLYTGSASPLEELGMKSDMENAVLKLLSLLPMQHQQHAEEMTQRLYIDPFGWYGNREDHQSLPMLRQAVWDNRIIEVSYENWEGDDFQLILEPYSLVFKADNWYVVGQQVNTNKMRTYRVSRMHQVRITDQNFEHDSDFDIKDYWQESCEIFQKRVPIYPVKLRAKPSVMTYFRSMMTGRYAVIAESDSWLELDIQFTVFEEARTSVLGLGTQVEVIYLPELHDAVIELAQAVVEKYR